MTEPKRLIDLLVNDLQEESDSVIYVHPNSLERITADCLAVIDAKDNGNYQHEKGFIWFTWVSVAYKEVFQSPLLNSENHNDRALQVIKTIDSLQHEYL